MNDENDGSAAAMEYLADVLDANIPDGECFTEIVDRVTVMAEDAVRFRLRCGLELTEPIRRGRR
jgi:hypothetical protein